MQYAAVKQSNETMDMRFNFFYSLPYLSSPSIHSQEQMIIFKKKINVN